MAIVEVSNKGQVAVHLCEHCGREEKVTKGQWRIVESDPEQAVFSSPPCPDCRSEQALFAHDWIFQNERTKEVPELDVEVIAVAGIPIPTAKERKVFDHVTGEVVTAVQPQPEVFMDHECFDAQQQVLIRKVAHALGRKIARRSNGKFSYDQEPREPDPNKVRRAIRGARAEVDSTGITGSLPRP